jgi:hypothetical protein
MISKWFEDVAARLCFVDFHDMAAPCRLFVIFFYVDQKGNLHPRIL